MFSDRLAKLRKERGLTQKDLAERLDVSVDSVRRWEQEKRSPDVGMLNKIARALETTVSYISGETEDATPKPDEIRALKDEMDSATSFIRRGDIIGSGKFLFYNMGNGESFLMPATNENQAWFREVMGNAIARRAMAV